MNDATQAAVVERLDLLAAQAGELGQVAWQAALQKQAINGAWCIVIVCLLTVAALALLARGIWCVRGDVYHEEYIGYFVAPSILVAPIVGCAYEAHVALMTPEIGALKELARLIG